MTPKTLKKMLIKISIY